MGADGGEKINVNSKATPRPEAHRMPCDVTLPRDVKTRASENDADLIYKSELLFFFELEAESGS